MTDRAATAAVPASPAVAPRVSAKGSLILTVRNLWPYLWPTDRADLKLRVFGALALLLVAKAINLAVPFTLKWATDALAPGGSAAEIPLPALLAAPAALAVAYGLLRVLMAFFTQAREDRKSVV